MSLENQIAALVTASNNLTDAVNGKVSEINQKVNDAVAIVPATVIASMAKILYIDPLNGLDTNDGSTQAKAKKTLRNTIDSVPSGGYAYIFVKPTGDLDLTSDISLNNKVIIIRNLDFVAATPSSYGVIRAQPYIAGDGTVGAWGFLLGKRSHIYIIGFKLITGRLGAAHVGRELRQFQGAMMKTQDALGTVQLESVEVDINHCPFMHQHTSGSLGFGDLIMRAATFNKLSLAESSVTTGRQYMIDTYGSGAVPFDLYGLSASFTGAASWSELIAVTMTNVRTNLL